MLLLFLDIVSLLICDAKLLISCVSVIHCPSTDTITYSSSNTSLLHHYGVNLEVVCDYGYHVAIETNEDVFHVPLGDRPFAWITNVNITCSEIGDWHTASGSVIQNISDLCQREYFTFCIY